LFNYILKYIEYLWISINSFPVIIRISIYFIFFSCLLIIFFFLGVFLTRKVKNKHENLIKEIQPKIIDFFNKILYSDKLYEKGSVLQLFNERFRDIKTKNKKTIISSLEKIIDDDNDILFSKNYKILISDLDIVEILEKNIDSSNNKVRFKSIQTFSKLNLTISDSKILPHTYSNKENLYKEARSSYVTISNNDPFKFFDEEYELNEWDQINLLHQFRLHHKDKLPNFSKWIKYSKNKSQISFFIKMIRIFKQKSSIFSLLELLNNDDITIRAETIKAIGELEYQSSEAQLIKMYDNEPFLCQKEIIKALSHFKIKKGIPFLKEAYFNASTNELRKVIAEVIFLYGVEGKQLFKKLKKQESGFNLLILKHIENPLIPSELKNSLSKKKYEIGSSFSNPSLTASI